MDHPFGYTRTVIAVGGICTRIPAREADPKSAASADFATTASDSPCRESNPGPGHSKDLLYPTELQGRPWDEPVTTRFVPFRPEQAHPLPRLCTGCPQ